MPAVVPWTVMGDDRRRSGPVPRVLRISVPIIAITAVLVAGIAGIARSSPSRSADAAVEPADNVAFWYQPITPATDLAPLGHPKVLVHFSRTNQPAAERLAVERIHAMTGAAAYRYVQLYYLPVRSQLMDMRIARHPDWGFCQSGSTPSYDTSVKPADRWMFVDVNNRSVITAFRAYLLRVKSWGWDGIFLDLAHRALTQNFWDRTSTCARDPIVSGRVSADAYAALVPLARSLGLQVMVNAGAPADPTSPMRPDPADPACRTADWPDCHQRPDIAETATWILHETASNWPDDTHWLADAHALATDEAFAHRGEARVAALGVYRGDDDGSADHILYQWAVMKLYDVPAAFGTGVDRCGISQEVPIDTACNRGGLAPAALVDTMLGPPLGPSPLSQSCAPDGWHCIWARRYQDGMVVLNNTPHPLAARRLTVADDGACRTVSDATTGVRYDGGSCTSSISVGLGGFRAEVLRYGT
jgi:hypothetical protein